MSVRLMAVAGVFLVAACGGPEAEVSSSAGPDEAASSTPADAIPLVEICPQVEVALPNDSYPSAKQLAPFLAELIVLRQQGDVEAQNALRLIEEPTQSLYDAELADKGGLKGMSQRLDAHQAWLGGISSFAKRCKAVGSSALQ